MVKLIRLKKQTIGLIFLYLGLLVFLMSTDPGKLAIGWLILPFVWLFACLYLTTWLILKKLAARSSYLSKSKRLIIAFLVASLPTLVLLLKSIDQLSLKDFILFTAFYLIVSFYVSRLSFIKST